MDLFLSIINVLLVVIGLTAVVRFLVFKLTECPKNDYHYIALLRDKNAELILRGILERNKYEFDSCGKIIFAVDLGLDEETRTACEIMSFENSQIVFCGINDFPEILR